jgi:hypothetical protein
MSDGLADFLRTSIQFGAVCAMIGACLGQYMRNRMVLGAVLGFFLGPLGWLFTFALKDKRMKCPECLAAIDPKAKRCRHCGAAIGGVPSLSCPYCSAKLPVVTLHDGDNACPSCHETFSIQ